MRRPRELPSATYDRSDQGTRVVPALKMEDLRQALRRQVFSETGMNVYTVLDGASVPDLVPRLYQLEPEHACLYSGELAPDMAEVAPYLVQLQPRTEFSDWVLEQGWGHHWGILAHSYSGLKAVRHHFRGFLKVHDNKGQPLLFRYYDPRVMRDYLPTCNAEELEKIFGPVETYLVEGENMNVLLRFQQAAGSLKAQGVTLAEAVAVDGQMRRL